jgi:hypothetical protein
MEASEWKKPTVVFYREKLDKPETEPLAVIKARKISVKAVEKGGYEGDIVDFFTLMGDLDYASFHSGEKDQFVLCWFDDREDDSRKAYRRLNGVVFPSGLSYTVSEGKRTYNTSFRAKQAKIR